MASERAGDAEYESLLALCRLRRSVRRFRSDSVPEEMIEKILAVARTSPYASGRKSWSVKVLRDEGVRAAMAEAVRARVAGILPAVRQDLRAGFAGYAANFDAFSSAPVCLVPIHRVPLTLSLMMPMPDPALSAWERDAHTKSIACVTMLLLLGAESLGLGACFMTGPLIAHEELRRILCVPDGWEIGAVVPVGFPRRT